MSQYLLAIDQGTTGSTALILDEQLNVLGRANQEFTQYYPKPGWVEHDPLEILSSVDQAIMQALEQSKVDPMSIAAIGITNQRETVVMWDRQTGQPQHKAIVWQCRRTTEFCADLKEAGHEPMVRERTGLCLDPYFSGTKMRWLLNHVDGARERANNGELLLGTIDSYLLYSLTGGEVHYTDASNASRTLLMNLEKGNWDPDLLALFDIPQASLPEIRSNSEVYGYTRGSQVLPDGIPIAGMAGDQQAALFGQTCYAPGEAKCTYGTGAFLLMNTGTSPILSKGGLLTTIAWRIGEQTIFALEGSAFIAGAAVQWLRDGLGLIQSAPEIEALANQVEDSGGVYFVPALAGLGAPYWDPEARGNISGITRGTTSAHLARATLEGIAYQNEALLRVMQEESGYPLTSLRVDGGASANALLMQLQANFTQCEIERPEMIETTALGSALLAGLAVGIWETTDGIRAAWRCAARFSPTLNATEVELGKEGWSKAIARARL